ncbi:hypothetical protein G6F32_015917 [Rhizopus arrhizus]|nr:hypothetical protein G6F32_015917 [Rhizopus arrhizus]
MALFATLFGTRQVAATEHHHGMMLAIALESVIKLVAMVAVGVFAYVWLSDRNEAVVESLPRQHLPAAPVPRSGGRVRGCARRTPCALDVRRLPGAHLGDGAADRHRRCQPVRYRQWRGR